MRVSTNPYVPPRAEVAENALPAEARPPRPIAVWLMIALIVLFAVSFVVGGGRLVFFSVGRGVAGIHTGIALVIAALASLALVLLARGIFQGRPWARWLGLVVFGAVMVAISVRHGAKDVPSDEAERLGFLLGRYGLIPALLLWWGYEFAFSAKARRYFAARGSSARGRDGS